MLDCFSLLTLAVDDNEFSSTSSTAATKHVTAALPNNGGRVRFRVDDNVDDLRKEREYLLTELDHAKRKIKMLQKEKKRNRYEIANLKAERSDVYNALKGDHVEKDFLDTVFSW